MLRTRSATALTAFVLAGALSLDTGSAVADALLEYELTHLLRNHPQITASKKAMEATGRTVDQARSGYWPTVEMEADAGPEYISNPTTRSDEQLDKNWRRTRNTASVTLTQNLFDGFATSNAVRTARLNKEIARITVETTRQNTLFEGIGTYIDVLRQKRLVELARENEANVQTQLELEDERVQRGSGVAVDVLEAKRRLQAAKEQRVGYEGALQDAVSRYTQVFGRAPDVEEMIDPNPPIDLIPPDLEKAIEISQRENPAMNTAVASVEVARENQRTIASEYAPNLDLVGNWNYEKHNNGTLGTRRDYSVVVKASWDLFSGFSTKHKMSEASFTYGATKDEQLHTGRKVVEQVRLAWQALITARERMILLENAVNIAHEVWITRQRLREAGKETVINVLDAENELSNAQINFTAAAYDERLAVYQLLLAMGRLDSRHLGVES